MNLENCILTKTENDVSYNRYAHDALFELMKKMTDRYPGSVRSTLFPSGICAIDSTIHGIMIENDWNPINLVYGSELYCDSPRSFKYLEKQFPNLVKLYKIDITQNDLVLSLFKNLSENRTVFYLESCTNPNGHLFDFSLLKTIKEVCPNLRVIVDNTWLSSVIFNPFVFPEVDIVVNSLTKYYGAGRSGILGVSISRTEEFGNILFNYARIKGLHVSPIYCRATLENIKTVEERIKTSSDITQKIVKYLREEKRLNVFYPDIKGIGPSVFSFTIPVKRSEALEWMRGSKYECTTSFGSATSRFDQWPSGKKNKTNCRFSVGFEDSFLDIKKEFDKLLNKLKLV